MKSIQDFVLFLGNLGGNLLTIRQDHHFDLFELSEEPFRDSLARFVRRGMNCSKDFLMHSPAVDLFQAWCNLVKPRQSLRIEIDAGRRRWMRRTPAMAEGLTDHIWSLLSGRAGSPASAPACRWPAHEGAVGCGLAAWMRGSRSPVPSGPAALRAWPLGSRA
ncbi:Uncharacterised protein [uncultured archaeon]|nr:Uncharacterised protein [uncultured archaeon]